MKTGLESARHEYKAYFAATVEPRLGIPPETQDQLSFSEIAQRIEDRKIRRTYRRLAMKLLEANLHDHQSDRPDSVALLEAGNLSELRDWQDATHAWEKALWALASQGDT